MGDRSRGYAEMHCQLYKRPRSLYEACDWLLFPRELMEGPSCMRFYCFYILVGPARVNENLPRRGIFAWRGEPLSVFSSNGSSLAGNFAWHRVLPSLHFRKGSRHLEEAAMVGNSRRLHSCLKQPVGAEWQIHGGSGRAAVWAPIPIVARSTDDVPMETAMQSPFVFLRHRRQQILCSYGTCAAEVESTFAQVSKRRCDAHPYTWQLAWRG